ncbi:hypothetical protein CYLTODRAFT_459727, partial [Cylindrobasidium torrendii FP15055 ss-10]
MSVSHGLPVSPRDSIKALPVEGQIQQLSASSALSLLTSTLHPQPTALPLNMRFTPLFTLVLAAVAIAAPAPDFEGVEERALDDRAVSFEGIAFGLTAAIRQYRNNPSSNNLAAICRYKAALSASQQTSAANLGFNFNSVTCLTTTQQLNAIQSGLGDAYATFSAAGGQTATNTQALCAITTTLTPAQRRSISALGVIINVQCPSIVDQLNTIQAGLGQAYQAYTRNPNRLNTNTLCTLI